MRIGGYRAEKGPASLSLFVVLGLMLLFIVLLAFLVSGGVELKIVILILGIITTAICFFNTEMALYLIIFAMLFSPEFAFGGDLAEGRSLVFRVEDIIILVTFFSWVLKTALYEDVGLIVKTPLNRPIKIYILISFVATFVGALLGKVNLTSGLLYVSKYMEYFLVFFMFANNITDREQVRRFVLAAFIVALFTALYAFIQIPLGDRVTAPFEGQSGEPNTLGGYLILIISVLAGFWTVYRDQRLKIILSCFIGLLFIPFLFTLSRSSYVAAVPMFVTLFIFSDKKLLLSFLLLVFIVATPFLLPEKVKGRVTETFVPDPGFSQTEVIGNVGLDSSTSERIYSFKYAIKKWRQHPLLGWGVTGVGLIDSTYFRLLAETGLMGLASFFYLIGVIGLYLYATYRESRDLFLKGLSLGMITATAALLGHSIGAASFIIVRIMEPYWFFMACVFSLRQLELAELPIHDRVSL
jgi:O-antigen ligase